jgi:hypothetical protein
VIYTDDSSGGADDCNEGENYQDVFSALEVLRQLSDYRNVDRYQGREHKLEPAQRFLDSIRLRHGSLYTCIYCARRIRYLISLEADPARGVRGRKGNLA